jgi:signal transduction histidine kinase
MDALSEGAKLRIGRVNLYDDILNRLYIGFGTIAEGESRRVIFPNRNTGAVLPVIYADGAMLEQVITNLIQNALKYSHPLTNIRVNKGMRNNGQEMFISVASYGSHVPPKKERSKLFDLGYRYIENKNDIKRTKSSEPDGTGLGLYIARKFSQMHGGDLVMEEPVLKSKYNIPLLQGYLDLGLGLLPDAILSEEACQAFIKTYKANRYFNEIVNTAFDKTESYWDTEMPGNYRNNIKKGTYKITFTMSLPVSLVKPPE